jgi:hypothetical protein
MPPHSSRRSRNRTCPAKFGQGGLRSNPAAVASRGYQQLASDVGTDTKCSHQTRRNLLGQVPRSSPVRPARHGPRRSAISSSARRAVRSALCRLCQGRGRSRPPRPAPASAGSGAHCVGATGPSEPRAAGTRAQPGRSWCRVREVGGRLKKARLVTPRRPTRVREERRISAPSLERAPPSRCPSCSGSAPESFPVMPGACQARHG